MTPDIEIEERFRELEHQLLPQSPGLAANRQGVLGLNVQEMEKGFHHHMLLGFYW